MNLFESMIYSDVLQKIAKEIVQRSSKKPYLSNPYHPEDEFLLNNLNTSVDTENVKGTPVFPKLDDTTDSIEELNERFLRGNDVESDDILTDAGNDMKPTNQLIETDNLKNVTSNCTANSTSNYTANFTANSILENDKLQRNETNTISLKNVVKKIFDISDRAYFKPTQKRFVKVGSNDTLHKP